MRYGTMVRGIFEERENRFVARVRVGGRTERCHVKNTGRLRELLLPGAGVWLEESANPARKTGYSLITVERADGALVNLDSQAPNVVTAEWLSEHAAEWHLARVAREQVRGESRFDFGLTFDDGRAGYLEVKGVTLQRDGAALFPDAPTLRGEKHVRSLTRGQREGYTNAVLFVIQMKGVTALRPNDAAHPGFGGALREAAAAGVRVLAVDCEVEPDGMRIDRRIPVDLTEGKER